jgi:hypothetical protein
VKIIKHSILSLHSKCYLSRTIDTKICFDCTPHVRNVIKHAEGLRGEHSFLRNLSCKPHPPPTMHNNVIARMFFKSDLTADGLVCQRSLLICRHVAITNFSFVLQEQLKLRKFGSQHVPKSSLSDS